jgi:heterodisulfide reductase subunit A
VEEQKLKVGVFVCHCGGNISDVIDVKKVAEEISKIDGVEISTDYIFMCSDPGQNLVKDAIRKGKINRVVIAACSPRLHELTFKRALVSAGLNPYLFEHVNIREQGSWVHKLDPDGATAKAIKLIKGAVERVKLSKPLDDIEVKAMPEAVVLGGGIAGIRASIDLAKRGISVNLIEKNEKLGGNIAGMGKLFGTDENPDEIINGLISEMENTKKVNVYLNSEIVDIEGGIGNFKVTIKNLKNGKEEKKNAGAVIIATGYSHYIPYEGEYGYKKINNVVTLPEFKKMLFNIKGKELIINGKKIKSVGFIHCVGSRQLPGMDKNIPEGRTLNAHCSRVCCTAILHMVKHLKENFPEIEIFDFYQDIRTYGRDNEVKYYENASKSGVLFFRYSPYNAPFVSENEGKINIKVNDLLTMNEEVEVEVDLLVLATAMLSANPGVIAEKYKLCQSSDGFLQEVHPKLRPVEMIVGGIFLAGTAQAPFDTTETSAAASAAAVKATAILEGKGVKLEPYVAKVNHEKCKGHGKCVEICPSKGAIFLNENNKAEVNPILCISCGNCVAVCPERAVDINNYEIEKFEKMVDAIVSEE